MPHPSRRAVLTGATLTLTSSIGGCLGAAVDSQPVKPENLNHNAGIERIESTEEGLRIEVSVDSYFSCSNSSLPSEATIGIRIHVDGEVVHRDTWTAEYSGCMDESRTRRVYQLDVGDYTTLAAETEVHDITE